MPAEQPPLRQRRIAVGGGVEHHFDHTLDMSIHRSKGANVHAEAPGNR